MPAFFVSLITDVYSHKIVGWAVGHTLETTYPLEALKMALSGVDGVPCDSLIHHSDRGCQYCSGPYVQILREHGVQISMTQSGDPLENAVAERANGILKVAHTQYGQQRRCWSQTVDSIIAS